MTIYQNVKAQQLQARKDKKDPVYISTLTTLLGEASKLSKDTHGGDPTDQEMVTTIKKFLKNVNETLNHIADKLDENLKFHQEKELLENLLPTQLSKSQIRQIIVVSGIELGDKKTIGIIMNLFKSNYQGQYDSSLVAEVLKELQQ